MYFLVNYQRLKNRFTRKFWPSANFKDMVEKIFEYGYYGNLRNGEKLILNIIKKNFTDLPNSFLENFKNSIIDLYKSNVTSKNFDEFQNEIISDIKLLDPNSLDVDLWKNLQYLSIRIGLFQSSLLFREKCIQKAILEGEKYNTDGLILISAFKAAMDIYDRDLAIKILYSIKTISNNNLFIKLCEYFSLFFYYDKFKILDKSNILNNDDTEYLNLIANKSVAIVGPASVSISNGNEIDQFDVIVRLGYKGRNYDTEKFGKNTDISYYSIANYKMYIANQKEQYLSDLKFAAFKNDAYLRSVNKALLNKCRIFYKNKYFVVGSPTMIQNAVYDLLLFNPNKIKIFNTNFYFSDKTHYQKYLPTNKERISYINNRGYDYYSLWANQIYDTGGFAHHDLVSQLNFIRNLWKSKRINVDETCENILKITNKEYLKKMEKIYIIPYIESPIINNKMR